MNYFSSCPKINSLKIWPVRRAKDSLFRHIGTWIFKLEPLAFIEHLINARYSTKHFTCIISFNLSLIKTLKLIISIYWALMCQAPFQVIYRSDTNSFALHSGPRSHSVPRLRSLPAAAPIPAIFKSQHITGVLVSSSRWRRKRKRGRQSSPHTFFPLRHILRSFMRPQ